MENPKSVVELFLQDRKIFEFNIPMIKIDETNGSLLEEIDYYASINVEDYLNKELRFQGDATNFFKWVRNEDTMPPSNLEDRPLLHFTPDTGWINDPNGLVYQGGKYHMYFQYNPFDTKWDNMSWGHCISEDLLHWEQLDTVLWPDESGTMFSGCGLVNERGMQGLPRDALIFFYSAAGGSNEWSKGKEFVQRIAYSINHGKTLVKRKSIFLPTIERENRDPKIFWHERSKAYIMVLWLQGNEFAILRSTDLCDFTISQRLILEEAFECPDLFELPIDGDMNHTKWVFWCADGFYFIGDFDGYQFMNYGPRKQAYASKIPYAAQTISGLLERTVSIPWFRTKNEGKRYTGMMGLPRELQLLSENEDIILSQTVTREFEEAKQLLYSLLPEKDTGTKLDDISIQLEDKDSQLGYKFQINNEQVIEIKIQFNIDRGRYTSNIKGYELTVDMDLNHIEFLGEIILIPNHLQNLSIIIDKGIVELTAKNGIIYSVYEMPDYCISGDYRIAIGQKDAVKKMEIYGIGMGDKEWQP
jgi:sucrose-6-phosphate hydrolase SacC (GH32 family)